MELMQNGNNLLSTCNCRNEEKSLSPSKSPSHVPLVYCWTLNALTWGATSTMGAREPFVVDSMRKHNPPNVWRTRSRHTRDTYKWRLGWYGSVSSWSAIIRISFVITMSTGSCLIKSIRLFACCSASCLTRSSVVYSGPCASTTSSPLLHMSITWRCFPCSP